MTNYFLPSPIPAGVRRVARRAILCLAAAAALLPLHGAAQQPGARTLAATVAASSGDTRLMRPSALLTPLRAGEPIREGDRVMTGRDGHVELRFVDGATVVIRPATEFVVDEYRFDASGERSFFSLVRGAVRSISGAIGKRNRDDYRLETPTATVGIRGTVFETIETRCNGGGCNPGEREGLTVSVFEGRVAVANDAGTIEVPQGSTVYVRDRSTPAVFAAGGERPAPTATATPRVRAAQPLRAQTAQGGGGLAPEQYGPQRQQ